MPSPRVAGLLFILLMVSVAAASDRQLIVNVYVDDTASKKALVVGHTDDPQSLSFLKTSEKLYEENGQFYAVADSILAEEGDGWRLEFPVQGYYDEYHAVFYIPGGYELTQINSSEGLELLTSKYNGSLILDVQGSEVQEPEVTIRYKAS